MQTLTQGLLLACSTTSVLLLLSFAVTGFVPPVTWLILGVIALLFLFAERPAWMVFLVLVPVFGNRPGSDQAATLLVLSSSMQLVLLPRSWRMLASTPVGMSPLWGLVSLYTAASVFSLSGVPLSDWVTQIRSQIPSLSDFGTAAYQIAAITRIPESNLWYGALSVYWTLLAWSFALRLFQLLLSHRLSASEFWSSVQCSLVLSLMVGLMDYYELLDLRMWRALDPVVNPGDVHFRLQSWFGHSGWYAEFITLAAPSTLVWLLLRASYRARVTAMLLTLVLGEFVLILTFQRGGWLAYPVTLLAVWAAVYAWRSMESSRQRAQSGEPTLKSLWPALRGAGWKIALSLPLTLLASILIVALARSAGPETSGENVLSQYISRARDIARTSDRTAFIHAGFLLGTRAPLLGGGSELFAYHYQREVMDPAGAFAGQFDLPLYGSAHNVYAQTFAGKGIVGLSLLLLVLGCLIALPLQRVVRTRDDLPETQILLLAGAATGAAFLIYGNVQEVFYIQPLQILFFGVIAVTAGLLLKDTQSRTHSIRFPMLLIGAAAVIQLCLVNLARTSPVTLASNVRTQGCYDAEGDGDGGTFRWCGPRALITLQGKTPHIDIEAAPSFRGDSAESFQVWEGGSLVYEFPLPPGARRIVALDTRFADVITLPPATGAAPRRTLGLRYGRCLVPGREMRVVHPVVSSSPPTESDPVAQSRNMRASPLLARLAPQVPKEYANDLRCLAFKVRIPASSEEEPGMPP